MRFLLVILVLLAAAAPAGAQEISGSVSPESVVHGRDSRVTWRISITTGDQPAQLRLRVAADALSPAQHGAAGFRAARVVSREVRMDGPGSVRGGPILIVDHCAAFMRPLPSYTLRWDHGFDIEDHMFEVEVPASTETVLVVPAEVAPDAPYPGTTYGLDARVGDMPLDLPRATVGGPTGVPLAISTDPRGTSSMCGTSPRFPSGSVRISGRTDPALAGDRVAIVEGRPEGEQRVGEAVVGAEGWFVLDWAPPPGDHVIAARYASQRPDRADDFSSPIWFSVDPPPPPVPPTPASALPDMAVRPVVRGGHVHVRLRCAAPGGCKGVARLFRSGRRLAARRYELAEGASARVRLRLPSALRNALRRRGRLRAQVVLTPAGGDPFARRVTLRR